MKIKISSTGSVVYDSELFETTPGVETEALLGIIPQSNTDYKSELENNQIIWYKRSVSTNKETGSVTYGSWERDEDRTQRQADFIQQLQQAAVAELSGIKTIKNEQLKDELSRATQSSLDAWARTRGYTDITSAVTYANSTVPQYSAEGTRALQLRDQTWQKVEEIFSQAQSGIRELPADFASMQAELPQLVW